MSLEDIINVFATLCGLVVVACVLMPMWMDADGRRHDEDGR